MAQKIQLQKVRFTNHFKEGNPTQYRAAIKTQQVITGDKLVKNIAAHSGATQAEVKAVLYALPEALKDYLEAGHAVQVEDLVTVHPRIKVKAHELAKDCSAKDIKSKSIRIQPIGETAETVNGFQFLMTDSVIDGSDQTDDEVEAQNPNA